MLRSVMQTILARHSIPKAARTVLQRLRAANYKAYLVGGCVRDLCLGLTPHDWDVATDAKPQDVLHMFPKTYAVGIQFGTVGVLTPDPVEVTTFRKELGYQNHRRPTTVQFSSSIEQDLSRRDFTVNAIAWNPLTNEIVDPYGGQHHIKEKVLQSVGDANERFQEDALRMLRGVRFVAQLHFTLEMETWHAIERHAALVKHLSAERVRDELLRMLETSQAGQALWLLHELGLLRYTLPELLPTARLPQGKPGAPTLLDHLCQTVDACPPDATLRLAALLHDVGKVQTRDMLPSGRIVFHGHEVASEQIAYKLCRRLRMPKSQTHHAASLIRMHMVDGNKVSKKTVRRWVGTYGEQWVRDLIALRQADHVASGGRSDDAIGAHRLRTTLDEVLLEDSALNIRDLAVNGHDIMKATNMKPGPVVGHVLNELLEHVLEDPEHNERSRLLELARSIVAQQLNE